MSNPYEPPSTTPREVNAFPAWYEWFYKAYWLAWWSGTALIVLSWFGAVTPTVGWMGFALTVAASLASYAFSSRAGVKPDDYFVLDSRQLSAKGDAYRRAIERFQNGASLFYDGVAFVIYPNSEVACGIVADRTDLDETAALELSEHARNVFDRLSAESTEFSSAVNGRTFRISIMSGFGSSARELCRVVDGKLDWRPPGFWRRH